MPANLSANSLIRYFAIALLLVPALLPTGTMLQANTATTQIELVICSGIASRIVLLDMDTGAITDPAGALSTSALDTAQLAMADATTAEHDDGQTCPFATLASGVMLAVLMPETLTASAVHTGLPSEISPTGRTSWPAWSPRAPPQVAA